MHCKKLHFLTDSQIALARECLQQKVSDTLATIFTQAPPLQIRQIARQELPQQGWTSFSLPEGKTVAVQWCDQGFTAWLRGIHLAEDAVQSTQADFERRLEHAWLSRIVAGLAGASHDEVLSTIQEQQPLPHQIGWEGWGWLAVSVAMADIGEIRMLCSPQLFDEAFSIVEHSPVQAGKSLQVRQQALQSSPVSVQVKAKVIAGVPLQELLHLEVGEAVVLDQKISEPWPLFIDGKAALRGELGSIEGRIGLRIIQANHETSS